MRIINFYVDQLKNVCLVVSLPLHAFTLVSLSFSMYCVAGPVCPLVPTVRLNHEPHPAHVHCSHSHTRTRYDIVSLMPCASLVHLVAHLYTSSMLVMRVVLRLSWLYCMLCYRFMPLTVGHLGSSCLPTILPTHHCPVVLWLLASVDLTR